MAKQLVAKGYKCFQDKDMKGMLDLYADDAQWVTFKVPGVPFSASVHQGKEAIARYFTEVSKTQELVQFEVRKVIAEGDDVAVVGYAKWNVRATGKQYETDWVHLFTLQDQKVVRVQQLLDSATVQASFQI